MGLYHQFQTAMILVNLTPFIQMNVYIFKMIIQKPCQDGFNGDHFFKKEISI